MSEDIESQTENKNKPHEIGINEGIWIMTSGIIMSTIFTTLWTIQILEDRDKLNNTTETYIYRPHRTALTLDISRTSSKNTRKLLSKFITKLENEGKSLGR